ncbi:DNA-binding transcriptional regulator, AcrR family [Lentzea waywayandensis]|uniref:DNA-binding transcriptional regulator, AcrR family n=1 Tax=Lentzea waywayandensis TaxID=84724 RepID=A0A1I6F8I7_9PSEU|nr:TetR/AcrR family transcriptional regulator [Lentzea waywayandensis]SFR26210.1 DNA-binding transcriptional regulator, AcrR family [Lentzea waywayandensis]
MSEQSQVRDRILAAATELGVGASIRDVCAAAGVTPPTVYHYFGDKNGLLDAVAAAGFERYLAEKRDLAPSSDPVEDLRRGWDGHVEFGLRNPAIYGLMYGGRTKPHPSMAQGQRILQQRMTRIDEAGLLTMPVDDAVQTVHAATVGTTILLIANPTGPGMDRLSERTREAVLSSILVTSKAESDLAAAANHLLVLLARTAEAQLTPGELAILRELLVSLGNSRATG